MAKFHARWIAAVLFLALLLAGVPSWGQARRSGPGTALRPRVSLQDEVTRIFRLVLGSFWEKTGNSLDPNGGSGGPRPTATSSGQATSDTGNSLDPNG